MNEVETTDPSIANLLLDVICDALPAAVLVYDNNDHLIYVGGQIQILPSVPETLLVPGSRLRDILGAIFDRFDETMLERIRSRHVVTREIWIAEQISSLWKERTESFERRDGDRWIQYLKRRLPSGYGVCIVRDASEHKKREEQWRIGSERIQITEDVLNELPFPVCVKNENLAYVAVNDVFCRMVGRGPHDILGRTPAEIFDAPVARRLESAGRQVIRNGISITSPELLAEPDGSDFGVIVHKFRVGKPGRYHVVTTMEQKSLTDDEPSSPARPAGRPIPVEQGLVLQEIDGRNILVVTTDAEAAAAAADMLSRLGADTSILSGADELRLFLTIAADDGIAIDLIMVDQQLAASCTAVATAFHVPVVALDPQQIEQDARALIASIFDREPAEVQTATVIRAADDAIDVLVAEDNAVNQIVFSQIIEGLGYRYAIAADGAQAVRIWQERAPRIVLMDITLPELNGFEACRRIRDLEAGAEPTPIIGVLPHPFERDREECLASGMNDIILKPISPEMLEAVFLAHLDRREAVAV